MYLRSLQPRKHPLDEALVRGVAQPGSASVLGTEGRRFESYRPDQYLKFFIKKSTLGWPPAKALRYYFVTLAVQDQK